MRRSYQIPRVKAPIAGLEQGFIYPQPTNPPRGVWRTQPPGPQPPIETALPTQQTYLFPLSQPLNRRSYVVAPKITARTGTLPARSAELILAYPVVYPERSQRERILNDARYRQPIAPVFSGSAGQLPFGTDPPWRETFVASNWLRRQYPDVVLPILGAAAAAAAADIFPSDPMPPQAYGYRSKPTIIRRSIKGTTPPALTPHLPTPQPAGSWWQRIEAVSLVRRGGVVPAIAGQTSSPTYVFPLSQPERKAWYVPRVQPPVTARTDGPPTLANFLFDIAQPDRGAWHLNRLAPQIDPVKHLLGVFTPPAVAQSYVFAPNQPSRGFWYLSRTPSEQVPAPLNLAGALSVATVPIPEVGGSAHAHWPWRYQLFETCTKSVSPYVWSEIVIVIPPALAAADACDTFLVPAELRVFVVRADVGAVFVPADGGSFTVGAEPGTFTVPGCQS